MEKKNQDKKAKSEAMKKLRESRKQLIKEATGKMKIQKAAIQAIKDQLITGSKTIPEIAAATGAPTAETLWYLAAMKKYGDVKEAEKDDYYFKYALTNTD